MTNESQESTKMVIHADGDSDTAIMLIKQSIAKVRAVSRAVDSAEEIEDVYQMQYIVPTWLEDIERDLKEALQILE